jgi:hypothetical protein
MTGRLLGELTMIIGTLATFEVIFNVLSIFTCTT